MPRFACIPAAAALTALAASLLPAQRTVETIVGPSGFHYGTGDRSRPVLGITTESGGARDTLGLLVVGVTPGGPAERAGIEEGDRILSVNGVSLRLSPDDVDAAESSGLLTRRLTRELEKVREGDEVELRVRGGGEVRTVRVRPTIVESSAGTVAGTRRTRLSRDEIRREVEERPVLGIQLQGTGSARDTLGVFVVRVQEGGPADRAGIEEGDRIAGIEDVSLRVSRDDAGDPWTSNARTQRLERELARHRPGDRVTLRVWHERGYETVRVTVGRAGDVYKDQRNGMFFGGDGVHAMILGDGPMSFMSPDAAPFLAMPAEGAITHAMPAMPALPSTPRVQTFLRAPMAPMPTARAGAVEIRSM